MTCIVAVKDKGNVWIGGDSAGVAGYSMNIRADEKVFKKGPFLYGFTSSFRMGNILRYSFEPPEQTGKMSDIEYMNTWFIDGVRKILKDKGFAWVRDNVQEGGTFIVCYRQEIYTVEDDYQVALQVDPFQSVGSGGNIAKAIMWANRKSKLSPKAKILEALAGAARYSAGVRGPFKVIKF